uniref:ATP-binding cassette domain-containing protein n=1 Tax=Streptococcus anginosus TaxID=1328 RepID=UPI004025AA1B
MTLLDVQHVKKIYKTRFQGNQVEALKDIHFTVDKGDYVAIMGESGSGKSTLLKFVGMVVLRGGGGV